MPTDGGANYLLAFPEGELRREQFPACHYLQATCKPAIRGHQPFHVCIDTPSTTLLVSARAKGLDLVGLNEPEDEILEEPQQHLAMDVRQRATRD